MIFVGKTVGIDKMRIHTTKFFGSFVHDGTEILPGSAGDMLRNGKRDLICGTDQNGIQTFFHGQLFSGINGDMVASRINIMYRIIGKINDLIHAATLRSNERG